MSRSRGVRVKRADLPHLLNVRDTLRSMIERVDRWRAPERNASMKLAYGLVRDQLAQELRSVEEMAAYAQRERAPAAPAPVTVDGNQGTPGCRGGAPAVMGHGCPALAAAQPPSAVGPAPAISTDHATALPADPLLLGPQMQELPVAGPLNPADIICTKEARA